MSQTDSAVTASEPCCSASSSHAYPASYDQVDAGVMLEVADSWTFQPTGDSLTDEIRLTEGNPRTDVGAGGGGASGVIYTARPLFGRSFIGSVTFRY